MQSGPDARLPKADSQTVADAGKESSPNGGCGCYISVPENNRQAPIGLDGALLYGSLTLGFVAAHRHRFRNFIRALLTPDKTKEA